MTGAQNVSTAVGWGLEGHRRYAIAAMQTVPQTARIGQIRLRETGFGTGCGAGTGQWMSARYDPCGISKRTSSPTGDSP